MPLPVPNGFCDFDPIHKIFATSVRPELAIAMAESLVEYLREGSENWEIKGIKEEPRFLLREGSGVPGDENVYVYGDVTYRDDISPGFPYVKIRAVYPDGISENWGDNQMLGRWAIVLEVDGNEGTGTVTAGVSPSDYVVKLSGKVWEMLDHRYGMMEFGFTDTEIVAGAPAIADLNLKNPITIKCEVYSYLT